MSDDSVCSETNDQDFFQENEEPLVATTLDSISDGFFALDAEWRFVYINTAAEHILEVNRDHILGKNHWEMFPSFLGTQLEQEYRRSAAGELRDFETYHEPSGSWFNSRCFPRNGGGISVYVHDISVRKKLEEKLRISEEKYRSLVEATSDCIWAVDSNGNFTYISPRFQDLVGYSPAEFLGKSPLDLAPLAEARQFGQLMAASLTTQQPFSSLEFPIKHLDGRRIIVEVSGVPLFSPAGEFQGMRGVTRDITERKYLTDALRESEEKYRRIFENELMAIFIYDAEAKRFLDINDALVRLYGYCREELSRMSLFDLSAEPEATAQAIAEAMVKGTIFVPLRYHRKKDGTVFPTEIVGGPYSLNSRSVLIGLVHDITARKQIEKEREQYFKLFNTSPDPMCISNPAGNFQKINPAFLELLGRTEEELLGYSFTEFIHPDDLKITQDEIEGQLQGGVTLDFENRYLNGEGSVRWLSWRAFYNKEDGLLYGTARDVTERIHAEEKLRRAEAYARNLIEVNLDPLVTISPDGKISDVNEASIRATGYSRDEMIGTDFSSYFTSPSQAQAGYLEVFKNGVVRDFPLEIRHREGQVTPVLYNASVFLDEIQQIAGVFAAARDITKLRQVERKLLDTNNELELRVEQRTRELQETQSRYLHAEKLSAIGKLSASIAHEFNNPLQSILSILKGVNKRAIFEEEDKSLMAAAIGECDRIKDLIRSLQDFNRPTSGKKIFMDLHKALDSLLLLYKKEFKNKRISLIHDYSEGLPQILAVPDQIKQVLLNLLTNAADACHQPGATITVSTRRDNDNVAVAIKDTGTGIKDEDLDHIFQPFFTTKDTVKGTGLGLSISYGIVKHHGGELLVESRFGEGTTFTVVLPIKGKDKTVSSVE